jgi:hypothetical protein
MFMLVFLVMFGPKKGSATAYAGSWDFKCTPQFANLFCGTPARILKFRVNRGLTALKALTFRFQFTVITSRLTTYLLLLFWLFFLHFGEALLLIVFNYSVLTDSINSSSFMLVKQHVPYSLNSVSTKLLSQVNFFILLLTPLAFGYLICLGYVTKYKFFVHSLLNNWVILVATGALLFCMFGSTTCGTLLVVLVYVILLIANFGVTKKGLHFSPEDLYRFCSGSRSSPLSGGWPIGSLRLAKSRNSAHRQVIKVVSDVTPVKRPNLAAVSGYRSFSAVGSTVPQGSPGSPFTGTAR